MDEISKVMHECICICIRDTIVLLIWWLIDRASLQCDDCLCHGGCFDCCCGLCFFVVRTVLSFSSERWYFRHFDCVSFFWMFSNRFVLIWVVFVFVWMVSKVCEMCYVFVLSAVMIDVLLGLDFCVAFVLVA